MAVQYLARLEQAKEEPKHKTGHQRAELQLVRETGVVKAFDDPLLCYLKNETQANTQQATDN